MNGAQVVGATARHSFASTNEIATMSFNVPFRVTSVPARLEVIASDNGFTFEDLALTVIRLGDA